jgi:DNA-binding transcriptional LysR family regulator
MADEVRISSNLTPDLARRLLQRDLDLVITSDPMEDEADLERFPILGEPFVIVTSAPFARNHPTNLTSLAADATLIRYTNRSIIGSTIERHLRRHRIDAPHHLEFDSSSALLNMVSAGLGWTITTPLCIIQGQVPLSRLAILPMRDAPLRRRLYIVTRINELVGIRERIHAIATDLAQTTLKTSFEAGFPWILDTIDFSDATNSTR